MKLLSVVLFIFALPILVGAHGEGPSYEADIDGYEVDIGYSTDAPAEGESVLFDFGLQKEGIPVQDFSDVWVRIVDDSGATVLATGVYNAEFGGARLSYAFPHAGDFDVHFRFEAENMTFAEGAFSILVHESSDARGFDASLALWTILGVVVGFATARLFKKRGV